MSLAGRRNLGPSQGSPGRAVPVLQPPPPSGEQGRGAGSIPRVTDGASPPPRPGSVVPGGIPPGRGWGRGEKHPPPSGRRVGDVLFSVPER